MATTKISGEHDDFDVEAVDVDEDATISSSRSRILAAQILDLKCSAETDVDSNDLSASAIEMMLATGAGISSICDADAKKDIAVDLKTIDATIESLRVWRISQEAKTRELEISLSHAVVDEVDGSLSDSAPETKDPILDLDLSSRVRKSTDESNSHVTCLETDYAIERLRKVAEDSIERRRANAQKRVVPRQSQEKIDHIVEELEGFNQNLDINMVEDAVRLEVRRNSTVELLEKAVIDEGLELQMSVASLQAQLMEFDTELDYLLKK